LDGGFLRRDGEEIPLRPKPLELLAYLVQHHGRVVGKAELVDAVWPDTAISDNSLAQCVLEIRRALSDDSQEVIRTVARRGYVFAAPVTAPVLEFPPPAAAAVATANPPPPVRPHRDARLRFVIGGLLLLALAGVVLVGIPSMRPARQYVFYTQITNFTDSAMGPALSPDGRMIAFFRTDDWWVTKDQIYVKLLPNGDPVPITHDTRPKFGLSFSPDGSQIGYTVAQGKWDTYTVSPLGGEPKLLLSNASGLTWLDEHKLLFSEMATGAHMGLVTATKTRSEYRRIYFPEDERGMAHFSFASPDRQWLLVAEMNPVWQPCRLLPMTGSSAGRRVGPPGKCTTAAWAPDGKWMYFGVEVDGAHHLWRQRFPNGQPEQITRGPSEEQGIAVAPDGRSLVTSIGMRQSALWLHDGRADRPLTSAGQVISLSANNGAGAIPKFARDGKFIYYEKRETPGAGAELARIDLSSGRSETVFAGISLLEYDISDDGKEVTFSQQPPGAPSQIWLAPLDRSSPPKLIASSGETSPYFGSDGKIVFRLTEGSSHYLARMNRDGSGRSKVVSYPIGNITSLSPDRCWVVALTPPPKGSGLATVASPVCGGVPVRICQGACFPNWDSSARFFYVGLEAPSSAGPGKTLAIPVPAGKVFPKLPEGGFTGHENLAEFPGSRVVAGWAISPGPDPSVYAYVKRSMQRNLFRIPLE
jgi:DNA-binding winged helix-turn-helix (wHTH) protein/Tol biopolymer transport system component